MKEGSEAKLASPDQFIPELPAWPERSRFIRQVRKLAFFHYGLYAQALAKLERGHDKDLRDVDHMVRFGGVEPDELLRLFVEIEPRLYRYPTIDPPTFRRAVDEFVGRFMAEE